MLVGSYKLAWAWQLYNCHSLRQITRHSLSLPVQIIWHLSDVHCRTHSMLNFLTTACVTNNFQWFVEWWFHAIWVHATWIVDSNIVQILHGSYIFARLSTRDRWMEFVNCIVWYLNLFVCAQKLHIVTCMGCMGTKVNGPDSVTHLKRRPQRHVHSKTP